MSTEQQVIVARFALGEHVWAVSHAVSSNNSFTVSIMEPPTAELTTAETKENATQKYLRNEAQRMSESPKRCLCECGCETRAASETTTTLEETTSDGAGGAHRPSDLPVAE